MTNSNDTDKLIKLAKDCGADYFDNSCTVIVDDGEIIFYSKDKLQAFADAYLFNANQAKAMFEYCVHSQSDFNLDYTAKRIRRLLRALDILDPSDGNDNTLMGCLFSLLGQACWKLEKATPPSQSVNGASQHSSFEDFWQKQIISSVTNEIDRGMFGYDLKEDMEFAFNSGYRALINAAPTVKEDAK